MEMDGQHLSLLNKQSQRVEGEAVSSYMLRSSAPDGFLTASEVLASQVRRLARRNPAGLRAACCAHTLSPLMLLGYRPSRNDRQAEARIIPLPLLAGGVEGAARGDVRTYLT